MASPEEILARAARLEKMSRAVRSVTEKEPSPTNSPTAAREAYKAEFAAAIANATSNASTKETQPSNVHTEKTPAVEPDPAAAEAIDKAAAALDSGAPLNDALGTITTSESKSALGKIVQGLSKLKQIMSRATPEEKVAIQHAVQQGGALPLDVPNTPRITAALGILETIGAASKQVKTELPPRMRGYSKLMYARPAGEVTTAVVEAGVLSLIATSVLATCGIPVPPYSALHIGTYVATAVGLGTYNAVTKAGYILRSAAEGNLRPLVEDPAKPGKFSVRRATSTVLRTVVLPTSIIAGIAVAQGAISSVYESSKIAGGAREPLDRFVEKKKSLEQQLPNFAKIPPKLLEIAMKIETGKQIGTVKTPQGPQPQYGAWPTNERKGIIDELKPLFMSAGLDESLVDKIQFSEPIKYGYGPVARQKEQLIKDFNIESRVRTIINSFLTDPSLRTVEQNLLRALATEEQIRRQADNEVATFEQAFFHGATPVGAEAMMPYAQAIIDARIKVAEAAAEKLQKPIQRIFGELVQKLEQAGGSRLAMESPTANLDTADIERLQTFLLQIITEKAASEATREATQTILSKLYDTFIPGGRKYENTQKYIRDILLRDAGYRLEVRGNDTCLYERTGFQSPDDLRKSAPNMMQNIRDAYGRMIALVKPTNEWHLDPTRIQTMSDEELARVAVPRLDQLASLISVRSMQSEEQLERSASMNAARAQALLNLPTNELGKIIRDQFVVQLSYGKQPYILAPDEWTQITGGQSIDTSATQIDPRIWRELSKDESVALLRSFDNAAAWRTHAYLEGGISGLVLGVLLLSLYPVWRKNKKLRAAAPDYEAMLLDAENTLVQTLGALNNSFAQIEGLKELPPMDFTMLHAALRRAGEEVFPNELSENPPMTSSVLAKLSEALSRGPYAHQVQEIVAFMSLVDKLSRSRRMQRRLADILAPGSVRSEKLQKKFNFTSTSSGSWQENLKAQIDAVPMSHREVFRDAARGNLRFRIEVLRSRLFALGIVENESKKTGTYNDASNTSIQNEIRYLTHEKATVEKQIDEFSTLLQQLDRKATFERVAESRLEPSRFSSRQHEINRSDYIRPIQISDDGITSKRFSAPRGLFDDVKSEFPNLIPSVN